MISLLLGSAAAAVTLPGNAELLALTLGGVLPLPRRSPAAERRLRKLVVVVPAHDEQANIARCVKSLLGVEAPRCAYEVVVVADNCSDDTAGVARQAGATVWERRDLSERGKGFALDFAFSRLMATPDVDAVLVVDADTEVEPNFARACEQAFCAGAEALQCRYLARNPEASPRTQLMNVALMAFNVLRPRGRERLGLSVGILGNGWGLSRSCLLRVPYTARSVVEDLEHHLHLVRAGLRVRFVDDTTVRGDMPEGEAGSDTQRARWEGGRFRMIREHVPSLLREVASGNLRLLEPTLELLLLPLAYHVGALGLTVLIPFPPTQLYAVAGLSLVGVHVLAALAASGGGVAELKALAGVPRYLLWKAGLLSRIASAASSDQAWVRTAREHEATDPALS